MKAPLLLHLLFQVVLLYDAFGWEVRMPQDIHGLKGSCLVIPCSFSYSSNPPKNPRRVVWYQWVSRGYPLVYDPLHADNVIEKFRGKTDLYKSSSRDCSLLIKNLEPSHHGERLYAWIDPENIGYRTYTFYDVTSTILVKASPQQPSIKIFGGERTGDAITVECSTFHTCPYLSIPPLHHEADPVLTGFKIIGLYILSPSLVFLLACILVVVIIYKKRQRSKDSSTESGKKPFSKPRMPSPKSDPKSHSDYDYEADYINMDEGNIYGNV